LQKREQSWQQQHQAPPLQATSSNAEVLFCTLTEMCGPRWQTARFCTAIANLTVMRSISVDG
jgi:hypothetical protein